MREHCHRSMLRAGLMLVFVLALASCTKGGQFDPTDFLNTDMFDSKKPLQGKREPVFPSGVPGTASGVPPELMKGYQPPPEQAADNGPETAAPAPTPEPPKPKPKPKPKPRLARAPPTPPRAQINVGLAPQKQPPQSSATAWPAPPPTGAAQNRQSSQTIWPAPPPTGAPQQAAQPSQSIWPNPPAPGASPQ